jgi:hypothetical protein
MPEFDVTRHMDLVRLELHRLGRLGDEDLEGVGNLALMIAYRTFVKRKGSRFRPWARIIIRRALQGALYRRAPVKTISLDVAKHDRVSPAYADDTDWEVWERATQWLSAEMVKVLRFIVDKPKNRRKWARRNRISEARLVDQDLLAKVRWLVRKGLEMPERKTPATRG